MGRGQLLPVGLIWNRVFGGFKVVRVFREGLKKSSRPGAGHLRTAGRGFFGLRFGFKV